MARTKRRLSSRELDQLHKIESLLDNSKSQQSTTSKNEEINFNKIILSQHAVRRSKERLNMDKDNATGYLRSCLKKAKKIGIVVDTDGSESILYANGRIGIYVSTDHEEIKTVIKHENITYSPLKSKIEELHSKELRKFKRKENACVKRLENTILEANVEISQLELRMYRSRSVSVKTACKARISAIKIHIGELEDEIKMIQDSHRQIARSMVSVV